MQLTLPEAGATTGELILEHGALAGSRYGLVVSICPNPVCQCHRMTIACALEREGLSTHETPVPTYLEVDLENGRLVDPIPPESNSDAGELAKSFTEEITDADWERLSKLYSDTKQFQTERANLDEIDAHFSPETADGALAGYYEILPFARPITVLIEGMAWLFDDQYCVQPKCACHDLVMSFSRVDSGAHSSDGKFDPVIRYDYRTGQYKAECPAAAGVPSPRAFIGAMNDAEPDLNAFLANRHAQLRHLYRRTVPTPVRTEAPKIGRNEACPCGSGKKYKRCCGK